MTAQEESSYRITARLFIHCDFCLCYRGTQRLARLYLRVLKSPWGTPNQGHGCLTPTQTDRGVFLAELCKTCSSQGFMHGRQWWASESPKSLTLKGKRTNRNGILEENWGTQKKAVGQLGLSVSAGHDSLNYSMEAATGSSCHRCDGVTLETVLPNSCLPSANCGRHGNRCHCWCGTKDGKLQQAPSETVSPLLPPSLSTSTGKACLERGTERVLPPLKPEAC